MVAPFANPRRLCLTVVVGKHADSEFLDLEPSARGEIIVRLPEEPAEILDGAFNAARVDVVERSREVPVEFKVVDLENAVGRYPRRSSVGDRSVDIYIVDVP